MTILFGILGLAALALSIGLLAAAIRWASSQLPAETGWEDCL